MSQATSFSLDPSTRDLIRTAKRAARARGAATLSLPDLLCGVYELAREGEFRDVFAALAKAPSGDLRWPDEIVRAHAASAALLDVDENLPVPLDDDVRKIVEEAFGADSSLAPRQLAKAVLASPAPLVVRLRELNAGGALRSALIESIDATLERAARLGGRLTVDVLGQERAVTMLTDAYFHASLGSTTKGPRGIFTFLGPAGVGKTLLAESFADALGEVEGRPCAFRRFDMSTFAGHQAHEQLFGVPTFYSNARPGSLTGFVADQPRCVLLFDEVEKAHESTILSLLAVLDKGEVEDKALARPVKFHEAWLVFTTNLGREYFEDTMESGFPGGTDRSAAGLFDLLGSAQRTGSFARQPGDATPTLAPEFVSRLAKGGAVLFNRLETRHLVALARRSLSDASRQADLPHAGLRPPEVHVTDAAAFLFLLSLLPNLDARQVAARASHWAGEIVKGSFQECRDDIRGANPRGYEIRVVPSPATSAFLEKLQVQEIRVLVVDDDPDVARLVEQEVRGIRIERVATSTDLVREQQRFGASLVLLDLSFGESESSPRVECGLAMLEQLRTAFPQLPILVFSAHPENRAAFDRVVDRVLQVGGARAYLPFKPQGTFTLVDDDFAARVREQVEEARRAETIRQLRRAHKTFTFRARYRWSPETAAVIAELDAPQADVVIRASDQNAAIRFAGIPSERFADVVGLTRAKRRLGQVVEWLREPGRLGALGLNPPRGFLLAGPPGTGKTLLARAFAGEAALPYLSLSGGELRSKWVGESEERIRDLFRRAREYAPAIVFIDEIDGIARSREGMDSVHDTSLLNQLLASIDGFTSARRPVFVLAATNHAELLDPALCRPGRFDETLPIDLPNAEGRRAFFDRRLARLLGGESADLGRLIAGTAGFSPAELDRIVREAAYAASSDGRAVLTLADLEIARRLVRFGAERDDVDIAPEERRRTAWHEAGHAIAQVALLPHHRVDYVTIVPNDRGALGFVATADDESRHDLTRGDVRGRLVVALAGRAAETLLAGDADADVTAGAVSDLKVATSIAWNAIGRWGFDPEFGSVSIDGLPANLVPALGDALLKRVREWLCEAETEATKLLIARRADLDRLASALLERESMEGEEVGRLLAPTNAE